MEYLQNMKTLRSQMNDVEDEAAKISAEEETQLINIRTLENDIHLGLVMKNFDRVVVLDALQQTLDLIQQERVGLSAKLSEKRAYYSKVAEDMNAKLQKQQEWVNTKTINRELKKHDLVTGKAVGQKMCLWRGIHSCSKYVILLRKHETSGGCEFSCSC